MYLVVSVRLSVRLSVCMSELSCLNRLTFDLDYQSKMFVCVSTTRADAVDRLLIGFGFKNPANLGLLTS